MGDKPFIFEDHTKPLPKTDIIEELANIIFTDCGFIGNTYGLTSDEIATAMLAAAESMLWFAQEAGSLDDINVVRNKAKDIVNKRTKIFEQSGITKLIQSVKEKRQEIKSEGVEETYKDVHTEHCCLKHGCKYGDEDCSVATGFLKQSYPCEVCQWEKENHFCLKDDCPDKEPDDE